MKRVAFGALDDINRALSSSDLPADPPFRRKARALPLIAFLTQTCVHNGA